MLNSNSNMHGTIHAKFPFDDNEAAEMLAKALNSNTDKDKAQLLRILTQINNTQRQMIRTPYKIKYKKDLLEDLIKTSSGEYEIVYLALMETPTKFDVLQLSKAIKEANESVLIEIFSTRSSSELAAIKNGYQSLHGKTLEADVNDVISGDFKDILVSIIQRSVETDNNILDMAEIQQHVKKILGEKKKPDKAMLKNVISSLPSQKLTMLAEEYATVAGHSIEKDVEKHFSGDAKEVLLALIQHSRDSNLYFAILLNKFIKDSKNRELNLIRLTVSRSEIDLAEICKVYSKKYKKTLVEEVNKECKEPYRDCLIAIIKGNV